MGLAVCGESDAMIVMSSGLLVRWYEHVSGSCGEADLLSGSAIGALYTLAAWETVPKVPSDRRAVLESVSAKTLKQILSSVGRTLTVQRVEEVCDAVMQADVLRHEDVSLACGLCYSACLMFYQHPAALAHADGKGVFSRVMELYSRVMPVSLSAEWWAGACAEVDVTTARVAGVWLLSNMVKRLEGATASSWWPQLLDAAMEMVKMNSVAGLTDHKHIVSRPDKPATLFILTISIAASSSCGHHDDAVAPSRRLTIFESNHTPATRAVVTSTSAQAPAHHSADSDTGMTREYSSITRLNTPLPSACARAAGC
jgi:hypothetical protein